MVPMWTDIPWLTIMVAIPALTALLLAVFPALRAHGRTVAVIVAVVELVLAIVVAFNFDWAAAGSFQFVQAWEWIPGLGISWALGVNALGLVMILLAAVLVPLVLIATPQGDARREGGYAAWILLLYAFIVLIFSAYDVVLFYIAFEAMLIPLYFMIAGYGLGSRSREAGMKLLIYSLLGGLVMLGGLVTILGNFAGTENLFRYDTLSQVLPGASTGIQMAVFITFFIAFAIKAPMVPVHTWLPDAAAEARPGTSVLLVGILDKIGTFGMIILCLNFVPGAASQARWTIVILAVVSILWGGFAANGQKDLLRLVSFTSVSHFGFMVLGIFIGTDIAMTGAMFYMVAHGLSIAGLFLISGFLIERGDTQEIAGYGGWQRVTPVLAGTWLVAGLASIALPGLSGFVPEYLVLMGTWKASIPVALFAVLGVVLAAMYILLPYQRIFTGPKPDIDVPDLTISQKTVVTPLIAGMLILGIWSAPLVGALQGVTEATPSALSDISASTNEGGN
ncbi:NADH-quinone oxidoreductase subunit M [Actinomycetaceae bacterium WB03_NA08]|uniref:NADH-quinone oxidoreductase subunit M n=1 Tax=Scrofimicrobium canadense TaxID=2652290 RepID=A0A6N7W231_9ACTO|nr:NADH-quinone oxidoreductase subunit M [Scrofimicrobium canadense]MSS83345.1 NADH-quinone oxidoreductase subunit M [Scrofimicrobium canadense]